MTFSKGFRIATAVWAARITLAWVATRPLGVLFSAGVSDDRFVFEPGALGLLEVLRLRFDLLGSAAQSTLWLVLLGYCLLACVSAWATRALLAPVGQLAPASAPPLSRLLPRLGVLSLAVLGPGLVVGVLGGVVLGGLMEGPLSRSSSVVQQTVLALGIALILLVVTAFGVLHDLARTQLLARGDSVLKALRRALGSLRRHLGRVAGTRAAIALGAVAVTGVTTALTGVIAVERPGELRPVAALLNHQLAAWLLAALHVAWLYATVRVNADEP